MADTRMIFDLLEMDIDELVTTVVPSFLINKSIEEMTNLIMLIVITAFGVRARELSYDELKDDLTGMFDLILHTIKQQECKNYLEEAREVTDEVMEAMGAVKS